MLVAHGIVGRVGEEPNGRQILPMESESWNGLEGEIQKEASSTRGNGFRKEPFQKRAQTGKLQCFSAGNEGFVDGTGIIKIHVRVVGGENDHIEEQDAWLVADSVRTAVLRQDRFRPFLPSEALRRHSIPMIAQRDSLGRFPRLPWR